MSGGERTSKQDELVLFLLKLMNLSLGILSGLIVPYSVLSLVDIETSEIFFLISGLSIYLSLSDLGIGKPLYTKLKKEYLSNVKNSENLFFSGLVAMNIGGLVGSIAFVLIIQFGFLGEHQDTLYFILLSSFLALNSIVSLYKNIYYGVNSYLKFELFDLVRRIIFILFFVMFMFFGFSKILLLFFLASSIIVIFNIGEISKRNRKSDVISLLKGEEKKIVVLFFFSISELLIYNFGYIFIPHLDGDIVEYSLWIRLFLGMAIFHRTIIDVKIHNIVELIFLKHYKKLKSKIFTLLLLALISSIILVSIFIVLENWFFSIWTSDKFYPDTFFLISLFIMIFSNIFQHLIGSIYLSIGRSQTLLLTLSACTFFLMYVCSLFFIQKPYFLLSISLCYAFGALLLTALALTGVGDSNADR